MIPLTPREAERQVHRRARALAAVRAPRGAGKTEVHLHCVEDAGRWHAVVTACVGDAKVVDTSAEGDDPTAALLALPAGLAAVIESTRAELLAGLREGEDLPEEEPAVTPPTTRARPRASRAARATSDDARVVCAKCGAAAGEPHLPICPLREGT